MTKRHTITDFGILSSSYNANSLEYANGTYGDPKYHDGDIGGGIYWAGQNGTLINCLFDNNVAKIGGGLYYNSSALGASAISGLVFIISIKRSKPVNPF